MGVCSLKVKFNGMSEERESGCVPCGKARKGSKVFLSSRHIILPSGMSKVFHRNEPVEVSQLDGEWLLSWQEKDPSGMTRQVFTEVE